MNSDILVPSVARTWPDKIVTDWRRFSSGLWRVPEGDIQAAYSAESFPRVKVFTHNGVLLTNTGGFFSGPVAAAANCYPLLPANDYGSEPQRYTYEGRDASFRSDVFKLGPKVVFAATDARVEDWRRMLRVTYADGGWFARHANYGLFLNEDSRESKSENAREALRMELAGDLLVPSKSEMQQLLDGPQTSEPTTRQLDLTI